MFWFCIGVWFGFRPKGRPHFTAALPCIDALVSPKGCPILLRLRFASILWFRPKGDPIFFACPKKMGEKKGHPERLLFLIPVRFSGRQKKQIFRASSKN